MRIFSFFAIGLVLLIYGCNPHTAGWKEYNKLSSNFVQLEDIETGEKLKQNHKDETFILNNYVMEVGFDLNPDYAEWLKKNSGEKKFYETIKWKKNNIVFDIPVNVFLLDSQIVNFKSWYEFYYDYRQSRIPYKAITDEEVSQYLKALKKANNNKPPGQYRSAIKHGLELTSLEDFNSYPLSIAYSNGEEIKDVRVDYGRGYFEPNHAVVPYESHGIFYQDLNIYSASIDFPTIGSKAYVDYKEVYGDLKYNTTIYIPEEYFQEKKIISFAIPSWLDITLIEKNFEGLDYVKTNEPPAEIKKRVIKKGSNLLVDEYTSNEGVLDKKTKKNDVFSSNVKYYITYEFKNVKPRDYKHDKKSRGQSYNYPHFLIQYNNATEGLSKTPLTGNTTGLYKWYHELVNQLENDTTKLSQFTHKLIANKVSDDEKIKTIYYWVQDHIRYIAFEDGIAGFKPEECSDVFSNRYGDCKGMANLLVNMLQIAGFDARRVWIGTRHLNYDYNTPSIAVNNHMIAALKRDSNFIFLDGTETWCPYKQYAHRIQGRQVMVENGDTFSLVKIDEYGPEFNLEQVVINAALDGNFIKANVEKKYNGESRLDFIRNINDLELQDRDKTLYNFVSNKDINLKPSNITTTDLKDREGVANLKYDLEINNHVIESNGKKYVNIEWERDFAHLIFDSTKKTDFDFGQKICQKYELNLNISGYDVEYLPQDISIENDYYKANIQIRLVEKTLVYNREIIMKQGYLPVTELKNWNELVLKMFKFYNDYIILKGEKI